MEGFMYSVSLVIIILALITYAIEKWNKFKKRKQTLEEMKFIFHQRNESKQDVSKFLDEFIKDCFKDYIMSNTVPDAGSSCIQEDREDQIRKDLTDMVSRRMSPCIRKKILISYAEDHLAKVLTEKIFHVVSLYTADFNAKKSRRE